MDIKITKKSKDRLKNYHSGSGVMLLSEGNGNSYIYCDLFFRRKGDKYWLGMGNSKMVELTEEQIKILGDYAREDK